MDADKEVLDQISGVLESAGGRNAKAERIAGLIRRRGAYRWVGLYAVEGGEIAAVAWSGPQAPAHPRFPVGQGLCGAAVRSRAAIVVGDVTKDPRYLTTFSSTRSEIVVPVVHPARGTAVGLIDVESEQLAAFSEDDRRFLEECASALVALYA
jgi:GAF domain-containing protein